jgi:hypothetical protein
MLLTHTLHSSFSLSQNPSVLPKTNTIPVHDVKSAQPCLLTVVVKDTGIGMNEVEQARIFKRFSQANSHTSIVREEKKERREREREEREERRERREKSRERRESIEQREQRQKEVALSLFLSFFLSISLEAREVVSDLNIFLQDYGGSGLGLSVSLMLLVFPFFFFSFLFFPFTSLPFFSSLLFFPFLLQACWTKFKIDLGPDMQKISQTNAWGHISAIRKRKRIYFLTHSSHKKNS